MSTTIAYMLISMVIKNGTSSITSYIQNKYLMPIDRQHDTFSGNVDGVAQATTKLYKNRTKSY